VEGGISIRARGLDHLEAIARTALRRRGVGVFEDVGGPLGRALALLVVFLGLRDALFSELAKHRRDLEFWHFKLWHVEFRHLELWHFESGRSNGDRLRL